VKSRRLSAFIDALAGGRRPGNFRADREDAAVIRTAIALRAARPGDAHPDEQFMSDLYEELADQASTRVVPIVRPAPMHRWRNSLAAAAAAIVLVGGTAVATEAFNQTTVVPAAVQAPHGHDLRTGTFLTADNQVIGQIVAYRGHPSWVYMNIGGANYTGPITCMLHVQDGATVAVGNFGLNRGTGEFSRTIRVDIGQLRGAKLVAPNGSVVASATFA
jgi:hypothetical protein